jgi:hypothetical protein
MLNVSMFFEYVKAFLLIYVVAIGGMYYVSSRLSGPVVFPGDIYFRRGPRLIYVPLGSSFILTIILFILFLNFVAPYTIGKPVDPDTVNLIQP